jgi:uncharacterized delta-60 repeat protein
MSPTMKQRNAALLITALLASQISAQSGTLDPTYGNGGISILQPGDLHDVAHDIVVLGDNTSLICGVARVDGRNSIFVAHLYNDGSLDASWGTSGGYTFFTIGDEAYGYAMGVDSQGRIYVTGIAYPTLAQAVVPLVRADASGQPDLTFGTNGVMLYPLSDTEAEARDLVVLGDDRVLLAGSAIGPDFDRDSFIMRLLEDGSPDPSFGNGGTAINDHVGDDQLNCLALMDNGNAVGAGHANVSFVMKTVLFMVDGTGTPENGFGNAGTLLPEIGSNDHAAWGMVASGTRVFVTGWLGVAAGIDAYVACIRSDGNFHPPFGGGDGIVTIDANPVDNGYDIARYSNNDLIVCGTSGESGFGVPRDFMLARLTDSGDPVMSFGLNGVTTTSIQQDFDDANAVAFELDGKILLAGFTSGFSTFTDNDVAVCRYDVDWTLGTVTAPVLELGAFPNPANDDQITITHEGGANARALLRDAAGRVARDFGVVPAGSSQLSVAGLADGRYLLELRAPDRVAQHAVVIAR